MKGILINLSAIVLTAHMLFGSMGVMIYKHHCQKEGSHYEYFVEVEHKSCEKKEIKPACESKSVCCKKPLNSKESVKEKNCCTSESDWYHLDIDLVGNTLDSDFNGEAEFTGIKKKEEPIISERFYVNYYRGPPHLITKKSRSVLQTYLI